jgi:hypothetical protein
MDINIPSQIKLFANLSSFPLTGEVKTLYIDQATANHYYWSGSAYVQLKDGTKQDVPIVVNANITAENDKVYHVVANATFTDPTGVNGKGYFVVVRFGSSVALGGNSYTAGETIYRIFNAGTWLNIAHRPSTYEQNSNKSTDVNTDQASNTKYPSVKALFDWATNLFFPKPTGTTAQYLRGDGSLATFPTIPDASDFVEKSDFTSHSILAKQSGAGDPVAVSIGNNEILGRKSGGGSNIEGLSVSEVKSLLNYTASDVGAPSGSGSSTGTNTGDQDLSGLVPTSRNLTINGTTQDLSADRTYSAVILSGQPNAVNAGTLGVARYFGFSNNNNSTTETTRRIFLPNNCTLKNFYIRTGSNQPVNGSHVLTILKNGVATSIVVTIPAGSAAGVFSDILNSVSFLAGDEISIEAVNNASTSSSLLVSFSIGNL